MEELSGPVIGIALALPSQDQADSLPKRTVNIGLGVIID